MKRIIVLVTFFAVSQPGIADVTGNKLLDYCNSDNFSGRGICLGYFMGWGGGYFDARTRTKMHAEETICKPEEVKVEQVKDVVIIYLNNHPEQRNEPAGVVVWRALSEFFPCPNK